MCVSVCVHYINLKISILRYSVNAFECVDGLVISPYEQDVDLCNESCSSCVSKTKHWTLTDLFIFTV